MYKAPVAEIAHTLKHVTGMAEALRWGGLGELSEDLVDAILEEAGRFASEEIAPLARIGDENGSVWADAAVTTPPGWKEMYRRWCEGGWNALAGPPEFGGQGLPTMLSVAATEMWNSASMGFGVGPVLTMGAVEALDKHACDALKTTYLAKLVSGEWMGTMNLTEPQAGSDLNAVRARAERGDDGTYRIFGQKIFITYGEHDFTDNIVHLVLARLPDAPPGTRGISLFLVPKFIPDADGTPGARNDVFCASIEEKLGIHASPTCTMIYGDGFAKDREPGAVGWLVGEENRGLACMFTMMNNARLSVGIQGVAVAEAACQKALAYARERRQGRAPGDTVRRHEPDRAAPRRQAHASHHEGADRGRPRDRLFLRARHRHGPPRGGREGAALAGARQPFDPDRQGVFDRHRRRGRLARRSGARRHGLHRGDRGGRALSRRAHRPDLRGHQWHPGDRPRHPQAAAFGRRAGRRATSPSCAGTPRPSAPPTCQASAVRREKIAAALDDLEAATGRLHAWHAAGEQTALLAGATPYLRLFALAAGGAYLARSALAGGDAERVGLCRFFAENLVGESAALRDRVVEGAESLAAAELGA